MPLNRRNLLLGSLATAFATPSRAQPQRPQGLDAAQFGVRANAPEDQSHALQRAIDRAARAHRPLWLAPGLYRAGGLQLRAGSHLVGVRGASRIALTAGPALLSAQGAEAVTLSDLTLDGGNRPLDPNGGLINFMAATALRITGCAIADAGGNAVNLLQCSGEISGNTMTGSADNALFCNDSKLTIGANAIARSGNGGIRVWQSAKRSDGSLVTGNTIEDTAARAGGTGQNGNAINVYRAADVTVRDNIIRRAAFSAIRGNAASHIHILGNRCFALEEVAIYSEFEFEDATVADNLIDGAGSGISVTNFKEGGRLAVVRGNTVRNIWSRMPGAKPEDGGVGIGVEADATVSGNTVENAQTAGIGAGWGPYLRDVTVAGNVVRGCGVGVAVSVVQGAGRAAIVDNRLIGSKRGAIVGMEWHKAVTGDLAVSGAERYPQLRLSGNKVS